MHSVNCFDLLICEQFRVNMDLAVVARKRAD